MPSSWKFPEEPDDSKRVMDDAIDPAMPQNPEGVRDGGGCSAGKKTDGSSSTQEKMDDATGEQTRSLSTETGTHDVGIESREKRMEILERLEEYLRSMRTEQPSGATSGSRGLLADRVEVLLQTITNDILRGCSTLPRLEAGRVSCAYFATGCVTHKFRADYKLFRWLVADVENKVPPSAGIVFMPSGEEIWEQNGKRQSHIVFPRASTFFDYVRITRDMNKVNIAKEDRNQARVSGLRSVRVVRSRSENFARPGQTNHYVRREKLCDHTN